MNNRSEETLMAFPCSYKLGEGMDRLLNSSSVFDHSKTINEGDFGTQFEWELQILTVKLLEEGKTREVELELWSGSAASSLQRRIRPRY